MASAQAFADVDPVYVGTRQHDGAQTLSVNRLMILTCATAYSAAGSLTKMCMTMTVAAL